jgi:hypothetical protein
MSLISYVKIVMNKRLPISESHDDSNRCTPYRGKPDQHGTYASHASPRTSGIRFLRVVPVRDNLLWVIDRFGWISLLSRKMDPDTIHNTPADRSAGPYQFLSQANQWSSRLKPSFKLLGLLGSYHQHAIGTFNTCSQGPTHRSLTDTDGSYSLRGADFSYTTPRPTQPAISPFHLRASPSLRLSINSLPSELKGDQTLNLMSWSLHSTSTVSYHLSIAWANDVPPRIGLTRINMKVIFNVTTIPYNSYKLNAQS